MYPQCPAGTFCHVIQPGEPLQTVADRYQVSLEALYEANPELNPNLYYEGQVIYIPVAEQDYDFDDDDFDWDDWDDWDGDYDDSYDSIQEQRRPPGPPRRPGRRPPGPPRGAYQRPPSGPPPRYIPAEPRGLYRVDPGAIRRCLFRFTYIWLRNGQSFWAYLTFVGGNSVAGWRFIRGRWVYFGVSLWEIRSFQC